LYFFVRVGCVLPHFLVDHFPPLVGGFRVLNLLLMKEEVQLLWQLAGHWLKS